MKYFVFIYFVSIFFVGYYCRFKCIKNGAMLHWLKQIVWEIRYRSPPLHVSPPHYSMVMSKRRHQFVSEIVLEKYEESRKHSWKSLKLNAILSRDVLRLERLDPPEIVVGGQFIQRLHYRCHSNRSNETVALLLCFDAVSNVDGNFFKRINKVVWDPVSSTSAVKHYRKYSQGWKIDANKYRTLFIPFTVLGEDRYKLYETRHNITYSELDRFCRQELDRLITVTHQLFDYLNVTYIGHSGTLLGSLRHHGSIPWDDDADYLIPFHDLSKILGFLSRGHAEKYSTQDETIIKGAQLWWRTYSSRVAYEEVNRSVEYFQTLLDVAINEPFRNRGFAVKIFLHNAIKPHPYNWKFPSLDLFTFEIVDQNYSALKENIPLHCTQFYRNSALIRWSPFQIFSDVLAKFQNKILKTKISPSECIYLHIFYTGEIVKISEVFPLVLRPLNRLSIAVPRDMEHTKSSDLPSNFYSVCNNGGWSHLYEVGRFSKTMPCSLLSPYLPFVTLREHRTVNNSVFNSTKLQSVLKPLKFSLESVVEQIEFYKDISNNTHSSVAEMSSVCKIHLKNKYDLFRVQHNRCFSFERPPFINQLKEFTSQDFDDLMHQSVKSIERHQTATTEFIYEQLTVSDFMISELIAVDHSRHAVTPLP